MAADEQARAYWQSASDTFVAGSEYYGVVASVLESRGGLLLLRETLSGWGRRVAHDGDYVACYRDRSAYLARLSDFDVVLDDKLATWSRVKRRSNHLLVLRRRL